jgi:hypothetical protein
MRLVFAVPVVAMVAAVANLPPAQAAHARDGVGTSSRCHCDRYLNPHYTERQRPVPSLGSYRSSAANRRY